MTHIRRFYLVLIVAAATFAGCGRGALQWKTFHDATAGFSADFPGDVVMQPNTNKTTGPGGPPTYHFECWPDGLAFHVTFIAESRTPEQITEQLEDLKKEKLPSDSDYTSLSVNLVTAGSAQGVEQIFKEESGKYGNEFLRVRTFITPKGNYMLTVDSSTSADANSPDVTRFFDSFKIDAAK